MFFFSLYVLTLGVLFAGQSLIPANPDEQGITEITMDGDKYVIGVREGNLFKIQKKTTLLNAIQKHLGSKIKVLEAKLDELDGEQWLIVTIQNKNRSNKGTMGFKLSQSESLLYATSSVSEKCTGKKCSWCILTGSAGCFCERPTGRNGRCDHSIGDSLIDIITQTAPSF